jgi:hypothetical protein
VVNTLDTIIGFAPRTETETRSQLLTCNSLACILTPPARQMSSQQYYARRCLSVPLHHPTALKTTDIPAVLVRFIVQHAAMFGCQLSNSSLSSSDTPGDRYISTPLRRSVFLQLALLLARTEGVDLGTPFFKSGQPTTHLFPVKAGPSRGLAVPNNEFVQDNSNAHITDIYISVCNAFQLMSNLLYVNTVICWLHVARCL